MIAVNATNEDIKYIISKRYQKDGLVVVDDLFILSNENCKKSDIRFAVVCEEMIESDEAKQIFEYYSNNFKTYKVSQKVFERLASKENCAGILILTNVKQDASFLEKNNPFILVCDGLEISGNIGTIFRSCEAVKIDGIIFTNLHAKILDDKVVRSSRGMIYNVPFIVVNDLESCKKMLETRKIRQIVCEPEQGIDFKEFDYSGGIAIIVGSERYGVNKIWFNENAEYIKIPMYGQMDSLNVGVATSIVIYEAMYRR